MGDLTTERSSTTGTAPVLVASNRGPVSFGTADDGSLTLRRGGGGLVSGLSAIGDPNAVWVCAALGDADRRAAREAPHGRLDLAGHDVGGQAVRMLDIDPETFSRAYNGVANSTLWFVHHLLYATPTAPSFDAGFRTEWAAYEAYNAAFADALAAEAAGNAAVLVQDYHLSLAPALLRARRPDLRIGHFSHTPWAPPEYYRLLPDDVARAVLTGILGADRAGFLTERWARAFAACCEAVLGATVDHDALTVTHEGRTTRLGVHALGADADFLRERAHRPDVDERLAALRAAVGERRTVVRVDRTELSKNIVRGLQAYRHLLRTRPEWHDRVVHIAFAYPSRTDLAEYRAYTAAVRRLAEEIDAEFATPGWQPLILHVDDDFPRSLAAYRLADVALVNPIRDGMNLVAKEVPVVSDHGCALVLSREAGAHAELAEDALSVNPYDVIATADALHAGLTMPAGERADRTKRLAAAATALPPQQWFLDQLNAL
ncbi:trehalose-6-phosphate synthase [Streptomyces rubellomurinus]|uniref:Alpha,alpha-trehalose-phosphate synthase n=2 Tax=Streptomyces TaxID=1883 RepID=A0A0F2TLL8_STRR3|nr:trehalose-6-phosphate synthase [Streptomyces rubellomurinus]KJS56840.1 alpha,alpha-trehalose-phosphate synthase [Streptomyces rubellomurinus subsp. indigoferus]KJS63421.1 alpha,alpha-trehalose-phosphate synthase [Streptomyces rubellomurinus]